MLSSPRNETRKRVIEQNFQKLKKKWQSSKIAMWKGTSTTKTKE
jgi:hypothetical protein